MPADDAVIDAQTSIETFPVISQFRNIYKTKTVSGTTILSATMKLELAASALLLVLPASFGFVPGTSRSPLRASSSIQSVLSDFYSNPYLTKKNEEKFITDVCHYDGKVREFDKFTNDKDPATHFPTKDMTGVDTHMTRLCATVSSRIYYVDKGEDLKLSTKDHDVEVIIQNEKGLLNDSNPAFAACICGETMILAWRGTNFEKSPEDLASDLHISPVSSPLWRKHADSIKLHAGVSSLCIDDLTTFEKKIIEACKTHGIKEIITTGHSLGGALAQVGHFMLRAQIEDESSPWSKLKDVNVRTVAFAGFLTTYLDADGKKYSEETEAFIDEIDKNSCNIFFKTDVVPHLFFDFPYVVDFIRENYDDLIDAIEDKAMSGPLRYIVNLLLRNKIDNEIKELVEDMISSELIADYIKSTANYIHLGNMIHYKNEKEKPKKYRDMGAFHNKNDPNNFRSLKYVAPKGKNGLLEVHHDHNRSLSILEYRDSELI